MIQTLKSGKRQKMASFPYRGRKILWIYSCYSLLDLRHDQKLFIRILLLNFPEMRPLDTLQAILSNSNLRNDDRYKNFGFSFRYVFYVP